MRISVIGLGYVGCVSAACLAQMNHSVIGVEIDPGKLRVIGQGRSPVLEAGLDELVAEAWRCGRLRLTGDIREAIAESDMTWISVAAPDRGRGTTDYGALEEVVTDIGLALRDKRSRHVVVNRVTVPPGTARQKLIPLLEQSSGKEHGHGFCLLALPEFLREGFGIGDFRFPPYVLIGAARPEEAEDLLSIFDAYECERIVADLETAEIVKYVSNAFHALKVTFANEIGDLCDAAGIDKNLVSNIFLKDTKLNLSRNYLRPGFSFGGSCLGKDLRVLVGEVRPSHLSLPVLQAIEHSNDLHLDRLLAQILRHRPLRVGIIGISFKYGTDDLRESPALRCIRRLVEHSVEVLAFDPQVSFEIITGSNRAYMEAQVPTLESFVVKSARELLDACDLLLVTQGELFQTYFEGYLGPQHDIIRVDARQWVPDVSSAAAAPEEDS